MDLNNKNEISAVYRGAINITFKEIPNAINLCHKKNLVITALRTAMPNTRQARIKLLSNDMLLDIFLIRKTYKGNNNTFMPNLLMVKTLFKIAQNIAKAKALPVLKIRLTKTTPSKERSGFTENI